MILIECPYIYLVITIVVGFTSSVVLVILPMHQLTGSLPMEQELESETRNFRAGHFPNGTAVLQIADNRLLSYCDGGTYTCVVNTTSGYFETRNFTLIINSKFR